MPRQAPWHCPTWEKECSEYPCGTLPSRPSSFSPKHGADHTAEGRREARSTAIKAHNFQVAGDPTKCFTNSIRKTPHKLLWDTSPSGTPNWPMGDPKAFMYFTHQNPPPNPLWQAPCTYPKRLCI